MDELSWKTELENDKEGEQWMKDCTSRALGIKPARQGS